MRSAHVLRDGDLAATFVPGAGMIGCSLAHRGEELLVQRGGLDAWRGTGRSFGLPLLHPWANRLRDWRYGAAGRAVTSTLRAAPYGPTRTACRSTARSPPPRTGRSDAAPTRGARLSAELDYGRRDDRLAAFPFPHRLELDIRLERDTLAVTTTVARRGRTRAARVRLASVAAAARRAARGMGAHQPERIALELDDRKLPTGERRPCGGRARRRWANACSTTTEVAEDARFAAAGGGREIAVELDGGYRFAAGVRARRARGRLPGADDGPGGSALDGGRPAGSREPGRAQRGASTYGQLTPLPRRLGMMCAWGASAAGHDGTGGPRPCASTCSRRWWSCSPGWRPTASLRGLLLVAVRGGLPPDVDGPRGDLPLRRRAPARARAGRYGLALERFSAGARDRRVGADRAPGARRGPRDRDGRGGGAREVPEDFRDLLDDATLVCSRCRPAGAGAA